MGMNLVSACHKCKVKQTHLRRKESLTMLPFYKKHYECMREDPVNVETKEDQIQQAYWMDVYKEPDDD